MGLFGKTVPKTAGMVIGDIYTAIIVNFTFIHKLLILLQKISEHCAQVLLPAFSYFILLLLIRLLDLDSIDATVNLARACR